MANPLMDKHAVAAYIGGITPRVARELMNTMPCVNLGTGSKRKNLRVYQSDLDAWLLSRKLSRVSGPEHREGRMVNR